MKKRTMPFWAGPLLLLAVLVGAFFLRQYIYAKEEEKRNSPNNGIQYAEPVEDSHPALQYYNAQIPGREILLACEDDLTDDGLDELVVIYHNPEETLKNWMVALINRGGRDL